MTEKIAKILEVRVKRLEDGFSALHGKMDAHLEQSGQVLANIEWLKRAMFTITGAFLTGVGALIVAILMKAFK